ncbi:LOW QUALITY PROTEIN: cytochrome P450 CYP736A12 [Ziziphus jujuba]|uniref:LOW QUALITY PROTEIN: cytochrome P450 CYP736A12 n=1 Tax=Ziziphus jujuba TaxID=326968 RepID=A0A6P3ZSX8_ZIZJJ|nr:LOW QUALITY PROTEIN: cytochrome P450 CYP736A12 [Ziziphus jujuba]
MAPYAVAILCVFLGLLFTFIFWPKHQKHGYKLPSGPWGLPILGNLYQLGTLPHHTLRNLAQKHGPIMSIWLGNVPTIVVSSSIAAELFLKTHDSVFSSRPPNQAADYILYGRKGILFTEHGPYWRAVRKLCASQLLGSSKVESFAPIRREELGCLVQTLEKAAVEHELVDLSEKISEAMENIIFRIVLGRSKEDGMDLKGLVEEALNLVGAFNLADFVPFLGALDLQGLKVRMKKFTTNFEKILDKIISEHEQDYGRMRQEKPRDFIDVLLSLINQPLNPHDEQVHIIERSNIKAILIEMLIATYDTSTITIEWTFSELMKNPSKMTRLQQELKDVIGTHRMVEETDLQNLPYLDMVVKETMRLHPAAPLLLPRQSTEDIAINGYYIPKNSRVLVNAWAIGRDPNVWSENVEEFYPERFIDSKIDVGGQDLELIPFGSGRRKCPGMQLGLATVRFVVAQLVHCFTWKLPNGTLPKDLDMSEKFFITSQRVHHLLALPTCRLVHTCP